MISRELIDFLIHLRENNYKEWFHENKSTYQRVRKEYEQFVALIIAQIAQFDDSVKYLTPKDCIFRINRDIRFSKDKSPYKTNFGAFIAPGGRKSGYAGYYFHLEPDSSFLAGGIYMPSSQALKSIRTEIYHHAEELKNIIYDQKFKEFFGGFTEMDKLKVGPKDFPKDFEDIDLLKHKHFTVSRMIPGEILHSEELMDFLMESYQAVYPLNRFLNEAIDHGA